MAGYADVPDFSGNRSAFNVAHCSPQSERARPLAHQYRQREPRNFEPCFETAQRNIGQGRGPGAQQVQVYCLLVKPAIDLDIGDINEQADAG